MHTLILSLFSSVQLFATPWVVAYQAPLSMGFFWQEYWSGLPCPSPKNLPDLGIEPASFMNPDRQVGSLYHQRHLGSPNFINMKVSI